MAEKDPSSAVRAAYASVLLRQVREEIDLALDLLNSPGGIPAPPSASIPTLTDRDIEICARPKCRSPRYYNIHDPERGGHVFVEAANVGSTIQTSAMVAPATPPAQADATKGAPGPEGATLSGPNLRLVAAFALLLACGVLGIFGTAASNVKAPEGPWLMVGAALTLGAALWLVATGERNG